MKYTCPDIMYSVNRLSIHTCASSAPAFQGINNLIGYLSGCPRHPIMYPVSLDGITTHDLCQYFSPGELHFQTIPNVLVNFSDGGEVRVPNDKIAIACVILCIFGVAFHWSEKAQPDSVAYYTDS